MKIAIYSRKSKFTGKGESIENQIEMCKAYIDMHFGSEQHIIKTFEDEGYSGKDTNRPQFKKMMAEEYKAPFDMIVIYRIDRISRSVADLSELVDKLNSYNTSFVSISENFDTTTPIGRAVINITATFAQLERETTAERVRDNMYMLAKTGRWLGGAVPIGYSSEKVEHIDKNDLKRYSYKLIQNDEINVPKLIFAKYLELRSLSKLETYLISHGIKTQKGCNFAVHTIKKVLTNPIYCIADKDGYDYFQKQNCNMFCTEDDCTGKYGFIGYGKTHTTSANGRVKNDFDKWIVTVGKHKGIVDGKTYAAVQEIIETNANGNIKYKQSHNPVALLSGLLVCQCGNYMRPKYQKENKNGVKPYSYMCEMKERSKSTKCSCSNLNGMYADKKVCDILLNYDVEDNVLSKYLKDIKTKTQNHSYEDDIHKLEAEKEAKRKEIDNLLDAIKSSNLQAVTLDYIDGRIVSLNDEIMRIDNEIASLKLADSYNNRSKDNLDNVQGALKFFRDNFDSLSTENKRNFLKQCISKIMWDGENLHIFTKSL